MWGHIGRRWGVDTGIDTVVGTPYDTVAVKIEVENVEGRVVRVGDVEWGVEDAVE